jgi:FkbM family methyltransferase
MIKEIKTKDHAFLVLEKDTFITECLEQYGHWEKLTMDVCRSYLKKDSAVIEVGAHIGSHTVLLSELCSEGRIYSFEMQKLIFQLLNANILLNNCKNVYTYMEAVSNENKIDIIGEVDYAGMEKFNSGLASLDKFKEAYPSYPINIISLDTKFAEIKKLDLIKIDAEGHEVSILEGAKEIIKKFKPMILTEFDYSNKQEIIDTLPDYKIEDLTYQYELNGKIYPNLMFKCTAL